VNPPKSAAVRAVVSPVHGRLAIVGITMAVTISIELHLRLAGQVSPVWQTLSEYVYGHFGRVSAAPLFSAQGVAGHEPRRAEKPATQQGFGAQGAGLAGQQNKHRLSHLLSQLTVGHLPQSH